jgi:hypothetical protein
MEMNKSDNPKLRPNLRDFDFWVTNTNIGRIWPVEIYSQLLYKNRTTNTVAAKQKTND